MRGSRLLRGCGRLGFGVAIGLALLTGGACRLQGRGGAEVPPPTISAVPDTVCRGDSSDVIWRCPSLDGTRLLCDTVTVESTMGDPFGPFSEQSGVRTQTFGSNTTLRIQTTYGGATEGASASVTVLEYDGAVSGLNRAFEGECRGAEEIWRSIPLVDQLSPCLRMLGIGNNSGYTLQIQADDGRSVTLRNGEDDRTVMVGPATNLELTNNPLVSGPSPALDLCGSIETTGEVPAMQIVVFVECNASLPGC